MFNFLKKWFSKKDQKDQPLDPKYEYIPTGRYVPLSPEDLKQWQRQCNGSYNPLIEELSICIPGGGVDRDGQIWMMRCIEEDRIRRRCCGAHRAEQQTDNAVKDDNDDADQHGKEVPNGN